MICTVTQNKDSEGDKKELPSFEEIPSITELGNFPMGLRELSGLKLKNKASDNFQYIFCVYMPTNEIKRNEQKFHGLIAELEEILARYKNKGTVLLAGDFYAEPQRRAT